MTEQYLMANGLRLAYDEFGASDDPALVLIMGLGTQMIAWQDSFCEQLAELGLRVIRFDNRDIGLSEQIESKVKVNPLKLMLRQRLGLQIQAPYSLHDMAADAIGVLDALSIEKAHWVGASMGGMITQILAAEYPERSLSLTSIMSSSGAPDLPGASPKIIWQLLSRPHPSREKAYLKHALQTWAMIGSPDYPPSREELTERILRSARRSHSPNGFTHQMAAIIKTGDRRPLLRRIDLPTSVIHGKQDVLVPIEAGIDTANNIRGAELHTIAGMGHDLPRQLLPKLTRIINDTINRAA